MADAREEERAAAQGEEVVLPPDARDAQDVAPDVPPPPRPVSPAPRSRRPGRLELGDRKSRRSSLPLAFRGKAGSLAKSDGTIGSGRRSFKNPRSSRVVAPSPGRAAHQATSVRSPARRSSIPTAASATAGYCASTPSISANSMRIRRPEVERLARELTAQLVRNRV